MADAHQVQLPRVELADKGEAPSSTLVGGGLHRGVIYDDDHQALEALCAAVLTELGISLPNKATVKLAWDAIAAQQVGGDRVCRATLQRLREWETLAF